MEKETVSDLGTGLGETVVADKLSDEPIVSRGEQKAGKISDVFGLLKREDMPSLSIDEIKAITADAWAGRR